MQGLSFEVNFPDVDKFMIFLLKREVELNNSYYASVMSQLKDIWTIINKPQNFPKVGKTLLN